MTVPPNIFATDRKILEEETDIPKLVNKYLFSYWYFYVLSALVGLGLSYLYLQTVTPIYEINSSLLIKTDNSGNSLSAEDIILQSTGLIGTTENVANEMEILSSFGLMEQVVKELALQVDCQWENWAASIPSYNNFSIAVDSFQLSPDFMQSEKYKLGGSLQYQINPINRGRFELLKKEVSIGEFNFGEIFTTEDGIFQFSNVGAVETIQDSTFHIAFQNPEAVADQYQTKLLVELPDNRKATTLQLSLEDPIPSRGVDILTTLIHIYNTTTIEEKNLISRTTLEFINERLRVIKQELSTVETSVEQFKKANDITAEAVSSIDIVINEQNRYIKEQTSLSVELSILESMDAYLAENELFTLIPANLAVSQSSMSNLIAEYNGLILKRQQLLETAKSSNPIVKSSEQQLVSLRNTIRYTIKNLQKDMQTRLASIESLSNELTTRLKKVPTQEKGLLEIKRQQVIKENLYLYLLEKREETALSLIATSPNARIINHPRSSWKPVSPENSKIMLGGLFGGLFFPFFLIIIRDIFRDTIQSEEEVKDLTKTPILGTINQSKDKNYIVVQANKRTAIAERFRLVRTNLQFSIKNKAQTILLTSSISQEGKSFIALNLAMSYALTKKKTILLGLDLRKPKMKTYIGNKEGTSMGISNYLVGAAEVKDIIQASEHNDYLDFITSGPIPFNPHELLTDKKIGQLLQDLKNKYDVIILDTPPVGLVSDALLLNEYITTSIYVTRIGRTKKFMLQQANELFQSGKLKNPSIIINGVKMAKRYGYAGYGYGYGESYGYYDN